MPMLLKIVEKELVAGATVAEFVQAFTLQQAAIEAAYTARSTDGKAVLNEKHLLTHLWGVLAYSRLPDGIRRSLKSQLLAWTSAQFSMEAVMKAATKDSKIEAALPADSDNRKIAALLEKAKSLSAALDEEHALARRVCRSRGGHVRWWWARSAEFQDVVVSTVPASRAVVQQQQRVWPHVLAVHDFFLRQMVHCPAPGGEHKKGCKYRCSWVNDATFQANKQRRAASSSSALMLR